MVKNIYMIGIFHCKDRKYNDTYIIDDNDDKHNIYTKIKCFHGDTIKLNSDNTIKVLNTKINTETIPGILILEKNISYGRYKKHLLYKFIPNNINYPLFLVPYTMKISFKKKIINKYVVIKYDSWNSTFPLGKIIDNIGNVDNNDNIYDYIITCKNLKFQMSTFKHEFYKRYTMISYDKWIDIIIKKYNLEDRRRITTSKEGYHYNVFTIDSHGCKDMDDACSVINIDEKMIKLSIYIANVPLWIDILQLWHYLSNQISNIYLPNKTITMLPSILSNVCSLNEGESKMVFAMDILVNKQTKDIINISFNNALIDISDNYFYNDSTLKCSKQYNILLDCVKQFNIKCNYIIHEIQTSKDVITYLMIMMNHHIGKYAQKHNFGIFKIMPKQLQESNRKIPDTIKHILSIQDYPYSKYVYNPSTHIHHGLNVDCYLQISSPIRRLVDLINIMSVQEHMNLLSKENRTIRNDIYHKWIHCDNIEKINDDHRKIKYVQNECSLISKVDYILKNIYKAYVVNKTDIYYVMYIPELHIFKNMKSVGEMELYQECTIQFYIFNDEANIRKKIMIEKV